MQRLRGIPRGGAVLAAASAVSLLALLGLPRAGTAAAQVAPQPTGEPRILGTARVGSTVTATNGTWSGTTPFTFSYQWRRCPSDGGAPDASNCGVISDAARSEYEVRGADVGFRLRVRVTARNDDGAATSTSNASAVVTRATRPRNTSPPTIGGTTVVGQPLTANPGTWSGDGLSFAYQWRRCNERGGSCASIAGATGRSYTLSGPDAGNTLRVRVTARNANGSETATSAPTAPVRTAAAPPPSGCPGGTGTVGVEQLAPPARLTIDRVEASPSVVRRSTRAIVARFHVSACNGRPVQGALVYVPTVPYNQFSIPPETATRADGWAQVALQRQSGFPAANRQQLLVMFVRARKPGENVLGGVSTRRLVSVRVALRG